VLYVVGREFGGGYQLKMKLVLIFMPLDFPGENLSFVGLFKK
jgi:hypothetical protein